MSLAEAHTEHVWSAWDQMVKHDPDRTLQSEGHKRIHGIVDLTLPESLNLLAWCVLKADEIYEGRVHWTFRIGRGWDYGDELKPYGEVCWFFEPLDYEEVGVWDDSFTAGTDKQDHGTFGDFYVPKEEWSLEVAHKVILLAIDAIVKKHPEVLE